MAMYAHVLGLVGGALMAILGLISALSGFNLGPFLAVLLGVFVVLIELDSVSIPFLKESLARGIIWIIIAVITGYGAIFTGLVVLISGVLYLVYHFS